MLSLALVVILVAEVVLVIYAPAAIHFFSMPEALIAKIGYAKCTSTTLPFSTIGITTLYPSSHLLRSPDLWCLICGKSRNNSISWPENVAHEEAVIGFCAPATGRMLRMLAPQFCAVCVDRGYIMNAIVSDYLATGLAMPGQCRRRPVDLMV